MDDFGPQQWTPADELLYADVQKGLGEVRKDLFDGEVHPDHAAPVLQELTQKAAALDQRRRAAADQAMGEQFHKTAHAAAMQQSLLQANAADTARGFSSAIGEDPITGQRFAPPGWQQIEQPEPAAEGGGGEPTSLAGAFSPEGAQTPWGEMSQPKVTQNPDGSKTQEMTVWNGRYRTEATYGPNGRLVGPPTMYGPDGQAVPAGLAQASQNFGVPPDVLNRIQQQAYQLFPGAGVHAEHNRGNYINRGISAYHTNALVEKRAQLAQQKAAQDEHDTNFTKQLDSAEKRLTSQWEKAHPGEEMTAETAAGLHDQAIEFAHRRFESIYGKPHRGGYQKGEVAPLGGRTDTQPERSPEESVRQDVMKKKVTAHDFYQTLRGYESGLKEKGAAAEETVNQEQVPGYDLMGQTNLKWKDMPREMQHQEALRRAAEFYGVELPKPKQGAVAASPAAVASNGTPAKAADQQKAFADLMQALATPPATAERAAKAQATQEDRAAARKRLEALDEDTRRRRGSITVK